MANSIYDLKELSSGFQPLLLAEWTLVDGTIYRASTHPLSVAQGGFPYGGYDWAARIIGQDVGATMSMSDLGVDIPPSVNIALADPDKVLYALESTIGFKGAILRLYSVMWDAGGTTAFFSDDAPAPIKFIGTCGPANSDESSITIGAVSLLNFTQKQMPPMRIQQICAYNFPTDYQSRSAALTDPLSIFYQCGYSADVPGGCGNYETGTAAFTSCNFTRKACIDRLGNSTAAYSASAIPPIMRDLAGNDTGRFGGFTWTPPQDGGRQRPYVSGQWEDIINVSNNAKYGDYMRLCYGTTWTTPLVMGIWGDGNYTNLEVAISFGKVNQIRRVLVNGIEVAQLNPDTIDGYQPSDNSIPGVVSITDPKNGWWRTVNDGRRNGVPNGNVGWVRQGDPYGSIAAIHINVLRQVAQENSVPTVQILLDGASVEIYSDVNTHAPAFSSNPVWILHDVLTKAGWRDDNIDIQSFIDAAAYCDVVVNFDSMSGNYQNFYNESGFPDFKRFTVGFAIEHRTLFGDIVRGIRAAMRAMLYFNFNTGKLTLVIKQTLGDQQPSPITGSNNQTPISSVAHDGTLNTGYSAYSFNQSNIGRDGNGRSTLSITQKALSDAPNRTSLQFLNRENYYSQDTIVVVDIEDIRRVQQEVTVSPPVLGIQTFDHARRILNNWLAENYRGNPRLDYVGSAIGDTGGTSIFQFTTSVKGVHLVVGQIIDITDQQSGILGQLARIIRVKPSINYETVQITAQWHNDNWYQDTYGQAEQPIYGPAQGLGRVPYCWRPGYETPIADDAHYDQTDQSFAVYPIYSLAADNTSIVDIQVVGKIPVNAFPSGINKPRLELKGSGQAGGSLPTGSYYVAVCEREGPSTSGFLSATSKPALVHVEDPNDAFAFVVNAWPGSPSGYVAFTGLHPTALSYQQESSANPEIIDIFGPYNQASWGPPDDNFSHFEFKIRMVHIAGPFGNILPSDYTPPLVTSNSIKLSTRQNIPLVADRWAGRVLSVYALAPRVSVIGDGERGVGAATVLDPGSGYAVNDTGIILGSLLGASGGTSAHFIITGVDSFGGVTSFAITDPGSGYTKLCPAATAHAAPTPGSGDGLFAVNITALSGTGDQPQANTQTPIPIANFAISGNTDQDLVLSAGDPTTCVQGGPLQSGDVVVMRFSLTYGSDTTGNYFEDSVLTQYELMNLGDVRNIADVTNATPIVLKLDLTDGSVFPYSDGDIVVVQGVEGTVSANGRFEVQNADPGTWSLELKDSSGNGDYTINGYIGKEVGIVPDSQVGNLAFIIKGTGRGTSARIKSNTSSRFYIDGEWPVTPDSSSQIIIVSGSYIVVQPGANISNAIREFVMSQSAEVKSYDKVALLVQVSSVSKFGIKSLAPLDPFREMFLIGNPGTGLPGNPLFKVRLEEYAMLTMYDYQVPSNPAAIKEVNFLAPSVDETDRLWWEASLADLGGGSAFLAIGERCEKSRFGNDFRVGDFVLWDDGNAQVNDWEINQIISFSPPMVLRQDPKAKSGMAFFGSQQKTHGASSKIRRLEPKIFTGAIKQDTYGTTGTFSGLPQHWSFAWPNRAVPAVVGQTIGDLGNSSPYVYNTCDKSIVANNYPPAPGLRTMSGAAYINMTANLSVGATADQRIQVQSWATIRCVFATVDEAPTVSSGFDTGIIVHVLYIQPDFVHVGLIDSIIIAPDEVLSWASPDLPSSKMMPYHIMNRVISSWPPNEFPMVLFDGSTIFPGSFRKQNGELYDLTFEDRHAQNPFFAPDGFIELYVEQVGTDFPGSGLKVCVQL